MLAIKEHLRWRMRHGVGWVSGAPSPRYGVDPSQVEPLVAPEPAAEQPAHTRGPAPSPEPDRDRGQRWRPPERPQEAPRQEPEQQPARQEPAPTVAPGDLKQVREHLGDCQRCRLWRTRTNLVFGQGATEADLMFVGEAPGYEEDRRGEAFVGAAGQLLTKMIKAMGLEREEVYIANIIKCRPPRNRDPAPNEIAACEVFLKQQIDAINPGIIVCLGAFAARTLLQQDTGIGRLRGRFHAYHGVPLMPTYHPAYLLRSPEAKRPAWNDLQMVMTEMDRLGLQRRR